MYSFEYITAVARLFQHNKLNFFSINNEQAVAVLDLLCDVIYKAGEKRTCQFAIWCIVKQELSSQILTQQVCVKSQKMLRYTKELIVIFYSDLPYSWTKFWMLWNMLSSRSGLILWQLSKRHWTQLTGLINDLRSSRSIFILVSRYDIAVFELRLLEVIPDAMKSAVCQWVPLVYPLVVHANSVIRKQTYEALDVAVSIPYEQRESISDKLASDLKVCE